MAATLLKACCSPLPVSAGRRVSCLLFHAGARAVRPDQQAPWRTLSSGRRCLSAAALGLGPRLRPLHLLLATGGGYLGYDQYGRYRDRQLECMGIEVPPRLANKTQLSVTRSSPPISADDVGKAEDNCHPTPSATPALLQNRLDKGA